jgi:hypothetical protein
VKDILDFTWDDIELIDYEHEAGIKGAVSIWFKSNYLEKNRRDFCSTVSFIFCILKQFKKGFFPYIFQFKL